MQRRLNGLGFDTKVNGKFDEETRSVIRRWQAARGYPTSGYLNKLQHKALLAEIVATTQTSSSDDSDDSDDRTGNRDARRQKKPARQRVELRTEQQNLRRQLSDWDDYEQDDIDVKL